MAKMNLKMLSMWLVAIGAVNWGLTAFGWNVVEWLADATAPVVGTVIYVAIGLAGLMVGKDLIKK